MKHGVELLKHKYSTIINVKAAQLCLAFEEHGYIAEHVRVLQVNQGMACYLLLDHPPVTVQWIFRLFSLGQQSQFTWTAKPV